jgi:hypothetical protein
MPDTIRVAATLIQFRGDFLHRHDRQVTTRLHQGIQDREPGRIGQCLERLDVVYGPGLLRFRLRRGLFHSDILPHAHGHVIIHVSMNDDVKVRGDENVNDGEKVRGGEGR